MTVASLEPVRDGWLALALRLHDEGGYGAPYHASGIVAVQNGEAEIMALTTTRPFTRADREAVRKALAAAGIRHATWDRRPGERLVTLHRAVQSRSDTSP